MSKKAFPIYAIPDNARYAILKGKKMLFAFDAEEIVYVVSQPASRPTLQSQVNESVAATVQDMDVEDLPDICPMDATLCLDSQPMQPEACHHPEHMEFDESDTFPKSHLVAAEELPLDLTMPTSMVKKLPYEPKPTDWMMKTHAPKYDSLSASTNIPQCNDSELMESGEFDMFLNSLFVLAEEVPLDLTMQTSMVKKTAFEPKPTDWMMKTHAPKHDSLSELTNISQCNDSELMELE